MSVLHWLEATKATDYRVVTLPNGDTISARSIAAVLFTDGHDGETIGGIEIAPIGPRVIIHVHGDQGPQVLGGPIYDEPREVFAVLTTAHRMWGGR